MELPELPELLTESDIQEIFTTHRHLLDVSEHLMKTLFKVAVAAQKSLDESAIPLQTLQKSLDESKQTIKEKEAAINMYHEELKLLYQQLADFRHQQNNKEA